MLKNENIYSDSCPSISETQVKTSFPASEGMDEMCVIALDRQHLYDLSSELSPQVDKSVLG